MALSTRQKQNYARYAQYALLIIIALVILVVADYPQALRELYRVTKPGGRIVINEFSTPTFGPFRAIYRNYIMKLIPPVARAVSSNPESYEYLAESILAWPNQDELARHFTEAGWQNVQYKNLTGGIVALHRAYKPTA